MPLVPLKMSAAQLDRALAAMARVVGRDQVFAAEDDRRSYRDAYGPSHRSDHQPAAAVAPQSTEELQALLRIANEHKLPLWPISRGKNLGYGGTAPVLSGSVVLDLSRMKRILEVDVKSNYCLLEPGVSFFDLYQHLTDNKLPLWMSVPANSWGSVVGNALERGIGYTPYGEHTDRICGLEVALPSGELLRTGMGAMSGNKAWRSYKYGFGPAWDQMFVQSNFGVVTKMGLWLMPEPESTLTMQFELDEPQDLVWALDLLGELRMRRVIDSHVTIGTPLRTASLFTQRSEWYSGPGAVPDAVVREMAKKYGVGWWTFAIRLFGYEEVNQANARIIKAAFGKHSTREFKESTWRRGEPLPRAAVQVPTTFFLQAVNWHGGRGGHMGFSPMLPHGGEGAYAQYLRTKQRFDEFGIDYYGGFTLAERYATNVNIVLYDRDQRDMTDRAYRMIDQLVKDTAQAGYSEYRAHLSFMDGVAETYDFNHHAMRRLNQTVKDALDPNGILAPGKSGIWPRRFRASKETT
ncbi:FAD-binding oxidoreductase [Aquabacterium sp.]|uniref:FAD-binding oxidoreductase n=1 Tax=Aquabacterium sp. TaxID=1872578 RepID=UPI002B7E5810|nr:FAD-binding oxidoreductase [Aquabacterium sp.]HSW06772.1 FAD-binding oxidoreductase [Aquabacterium sp.]